MGTPDVAEAARRGPLDDGAACGLVAFDFDAAHRAINACNEVRVRLQHGLDGRHALVATAEGSWRGRYRSEFSVTSATLARQGTDLDEQLISLASHLATAIGAARHEATRRALAEVMARQAGPHP